MKAWQTKYASRQVLKPCAQTGAVAVEMALVIVVLLLMVAGTIGFGRAFWYADALTKATRDSARLFSTWNVSEINSTGVAAAQTIVINSATAANISPSLVIGNVLVECLDSSFSSAGCTDGKAPINIRVSITGFTVSLGSWFPFINTTGSINYSPVSLSPHTTMRYMNNL